MKELYYLLFLFIISMPLSAQNERSKLIELGKAYNKFMFINDATRDYIKDLRANTPENLKSSSNFIIETITPKTKILDKKYLDLPDDATLKYIYIILHVSYNIHDKEPVANIQLVDSLNNMTIARNVMIDKYYSMLFTAYGNKVKPFNMSKVDFKLDEYNLQNETEKGIFFLRCIEFCGKYIWGYINIAKPMNTKEAYNYIKKFPKINGLAYYKYNDFNFTDFEIVIDKKRGKESYKKYYINKYYDVLLSNLLCIKKENRPDKEYNQLLLGSILRDKDYYKYSEHQDILNSLFTEVKVD